MNWHEGNLFPGIHKDENRAHLWDPSKIKPELKQGLWYLAVPYSAYPRGTHQAWQTAAQMTATFLAADVTVICPVVHHHSMIVFSGMSRLSPDLRQIDFELSKACEGVIIVEMAGWRADNEVKIAVNYFQHQGKPVLGVQPIGQLA